ncbi:hypothetical protein CRENBAI_020783 [Crenichthys baileyi]|uniref:Uncharacterized protein n=1 Tax=Crenichthys baileyi TaxID=28760 RepID=A0AAV9QRP2_9TELE
MTVQTSLKDQATGEEYITLLEYFRRAAEKSARQVTGRKEQRSPYWGTKLARPLPCTGPLHYWPSPSLHKGPFSPETVSSQDHSSEPEFGAARFLCPKRDSSALHSPCSVPAPSHWRRRRRRGSSVPASEGCANASSSLPEGWTTASRLSPVSPGSLLDAPAPVFYGGSAPCPESVTPSAASSQLTSAAAPAELHTPTKEAEQSFTPVCFSPYALEFMSQLLRRSSQT